MAALNFPTSPTDQDPYTANGKTWKWVAAQTTWIAYSTGQYLPLSGGTLTGQLTGPKIGFTSVYDCGTFSATSTIAFNNGQYQTGILTANTTFTVTAPAIGTYQTELIQDNVGNRTATWPASFKWPSDYTSADKLLSTAANARDLLILKYNGTDFVANLSKGIA